MNDHVETLERFLKEHKEALDALDPAFRVNDQLANHAEQAEARIRVGLRSVHDDETAAIRAVLEELKERAEQVDEQQQWLDEINVALGPGSIQLVSNKDRLGRIREIKEENKRLRSQWRDALIDKTMLEARLEECERQKAILQQANVTLAARPDGLRGEEMSVKTYILDDAGVEPIRCDDILVWGKWLGESERQRIVANEETPNGRVSTIFIGLDMRPLGVIGGSPLLWETRVMSGPLYGEQERYYTREEAEAGHKWMVEAVLAGRREEDLDGRETIGPEKETT